MFVVILKYTSSLDEIDRLMPGHVRFLRHHIQRREFIVAGRQVPRTGGVILARAASRSEVDAIMREDPFVREGASDFEIIEFRESFCDADFKAFLH